MDNSWLSHFINQKNKMPDRWVDCEKEIFNVLDSLQYLYKLEESFLEKKKAYPQAFTANKIESELNNGTDYNRCFCPPEHFQRLESINILDGNVVASVMKTERGTKIPELDIVLHLNQHLIEFCQIFACYLVQVVDKLAENSARKVILPIQFDKVFTFNYTNTFQQLQQDIKVTHVHGDLSKELEFTEVQPLNNYGLKIVLGIDNADKLVESLGTEVLSFTKFFQTIFKKTDASCFFKDKRYNEVRKLREGSLDVYRKEIEMYRKHNGGPNINEPQHDKSFHHFYIWGHSLDLSDKKYIVRLFELMWTEEGEENCNKITIFYYNEANRTSLLQNILDARMLGDQGKTKIEALVHNDRLMFESIPRVWKAIPN